MYVSPSIPSVALSFCQEKGSNKESTELKTHLSLHASMFIGGLISPNHSVCILVSIYILSNIYNMHETQLINSGILKGINSET